MAEKKKKPIPKAKKNVDAVDHEKDGVKSSVEIVNNLDKSHKVIKGTVTDDPEGNVGGSISKGQALVGLSKGYSFNLGNFESAKVACWITKVSPDDETSIMDNLAEISGLLDEQIEFEVDGLNKEQRED